MRRVANWVASRVSSTFARNVTLVAGGTAAAQVIAIASTPFITRLYGPDAFGLLGAFVSIVTVLAPVAVMCYPFALVLPQSDRTALSLVKLSVGLALLVAAITTLILSSVESIYAVFPELGDLRGFVGFFGAALVVTSLLSVTTNWIIRKKLFKHKAKAAVAHAVVSNVLYILVGLMSPDAKTLIAIYIACIGLHFLLQFFLIKSSVAPDKNGSEVGSTRLMDVAYEYRDFAIYRTPQNVLNAASQSLPVLMLAAFFGPALAGFYTLARMVLNAPTNLIGQSVGAVFYPRINEAALGKQSTAALVKKATLLLGLVGFFAFAPIVLFGPGLFQFVFGAEWREAGSLAGWVAVWTYCGFMNRPAVAAIPVFRIQKFFLLFEIAGVLLKAFALFVAFWHKNDAVYSVAVFCVISAILNVYLIFHVLREAKKFDLRMSR